MGNIVYIATSLDGYIARKDGSIDWLMELRCLISLECFGEASVIS